MAEVQESSEELLLSEIRALDRETLSRRLQEKRSQLSGLRKGDANFDALSREVFLLWNTQRDNNWDMSTDAEVLNQEDYIDPRAFDILLSDVNHELLLGEIASRLGVEYLSSPESLKAAARPNVVSGILFGSNYRPMVNLVVSSKVHKSPRNIIFLVDSGSPHLYLCEKAMEALGFSDHIPRSFDITFDGLSYPAEVSPKVMPDGRPGHFQDINLIGSSFLSKARCTALLDYPNNEVTLTFN